MDRYFSKLRRRPKSQPTEVMQLAKFHKSWSFVQNAYLNQDKRPMAANVHQTPIPAHLKTLADLLVDEEIRQDEGGTGVCMEYLLRNSVLSILVNIAGADAPPGVRGEVVRFVTTLINLLDDKFLVHNAVFKPTLKLIRGCVEDPVAAELYHEDLVDLMYVVCSKIHGFPDLLNIFFHDRTWLKTPMKRSFPRPPSPSSTSTAASSQTSSMTAVTPLSAPSHAVSFDESGLEVPESSSTPATPITPLRHPQLASVAGERTGPGRRGSLIFPTTSLSEASTGGTSHDGLSGHPVPDYEFLLFTYLLRFLHREGQSGDYARTALLFILELADGALGEFVLHASSFPAVAAAAVGALYSQLPRALAQPGSEEAEDREAGEEFQEGLDGFVKSIEFCQDILARCPTPGIGECPLRNVHTVFLHNILWPSLQSSSISDGSTEAVLSYVDVVLRVSTKNPNLKTLFQRFLRMSEEDQGTGGAVEGLAEETPQDGFDLRRLLLRTILSPSTPSTTLTAALNLLNTIITRHCECARLFILSPVPAPSARSITNGNGDGTTGRHEGDAEEGKEEEEEDEEEEEEEDSLLIMEDDDDDGEGLRKRKMDPSYGDSAVLAHRYELEWYMSALSSLDPSVNPDSPAFLATYEAYLTEAESSITACRQTHALHTLSQSGGRDVGLGLGRLRSVADEGVWGMVGGKTFPQRYAVDPQSPLALRLNALLGSYWKQSRHLNLAITGVIASLASCPMRGVAGWMTCGAPGKGGPGSNGTDEATVPSALSTATSASAAAAAATPPAPSPPLLYRTVELLTEYVAKTREEHPTFDRVLAERRRGLLCNAVVMSDGLGDGSLESMADATVTLEETLKEWIGIVQARRGLGIDG